MSSWIYLEIRPYGRSEEVLHRFRQFDLLAFAIRDYRIEIQITTNNGEEQHKA